MELTQFGELNIRLGWIFMVAGILSGSLIGMWSFAGPMKAPKTHTNYDDLPRRLVRLAHIAMFMLPLINVAYGMHIDLVPLADNLKYLGSLSMVICMFGVPSLLILASFYLPFKYLEAVPVSAGIIGLSIIAYGNFLLL
ncbi:MAG: hypothetical protein KDD61_13110 [Bdellovibrionales bacterium]|nr:hypothetical protein [Bdellovibrionales bacterium]